MRFRVRFREEGFRPCRASVQGFRFRVEGSGIRVLALQSLRFRV